MIWEARQRLERTRARRVRREAAAAAQHTDVPDGDDDDEDEDDEDEDEDGDTAPHSSAVDTDGQGEAGAPSTAAAAAARLTVDAAAATYLQRLLGAAVGSVASKRWPRACEDVDDEDEDDGWRAAHGEEAAAVAAHELAQVLATCVPARWLPCTMLGGRRED
eukprot:COSAG01_NODE_10153_length_2231_cov_11.508895_3_plen_162_part_00